MLHVSIKSTVCLGLLTLSLSCHPGAIAAEEADAFVVRRGSAEIHMADIDARLARVPPEDRAQVMNSPQRIEQLLLSLLTQRQLADKARAVGLDQEASIEHELRIYKDEILSRHYLEHLQSLPGQPDLEQAARERYLADPGVGLVSEQREVSHILVKTENRSEAEAIALIERLRAELIAQPERFEEIAERHSEDPSVTENRGRLGLLSEDFDEQFVAGARELAEVGELSGALRSQFGFHLIRLDGLEPSFRRGFDEIRDALVMQMTQRYLSELRSRELEKVSIEPLEADPEAVASLRVRYRAAPADEAEAR